MSTENWEAQEQQTNGALIEAPDEPQGDPAIEQEARSMGWVPENEWKGDPPKGGFRSAEDFVQRGKDVLPLVNKRLKEENAALSDKLAKLESETADKIARMERMSSAALKRQRSDLEAKYEALKEEAVETGDKAKYKEADKAGKEALADFDKAASDQDDKKEPKDKFEIPPSVKATVDDWIAENSWMKTDKEMNAVANARHERLLQEKPGLTLAENLADVRRYVEKKFPEKFGADDDQDDDPPPQRRGSPVEGGSRTANGRGSAFSRLPKDAQAQADRFIKEDGLFLEKGETVEKDLNKARERYAREYIGEQQ